MGFPSVYLDCPAPMSVTEGNSSPCRWGVMEEALGLGCSMDRVLNAELPQTREVIF